MQQQTADEFKHPSAWLRDIQQTIASTLIETGERTRGNSWSDHNGGREGEKLERGRNKEINHGSVMVQKRSGHSQRMWVVSSRPRAKGSLTYR